MNRRRKRDESSVSHTHVPLWIQDLNPSDLLCLISQGSINLHNVKQSKNMKVVKTTGGSETRRSSESCQQLTLKRWERRFAASQV